MAHKCVLCGAADAACGPRTISLPVDARVTGRIVGEKVMPVNAVNVGAVLGDLTDEEVEEFALIAESSERRKLKNRIMADNEGTAHTSLVYVKRPDGVTTKMRAADADEYVRLTDGAEIVRRGTRPEPAENETIGASKARVGQMFDDNGRQKADVQPMTTRTFMAADSNRDEVRTPAIGSAGAASTTGDESGTVSNSQGATTPKRPTAHVPAKTGQTTTE